MTTARAGHWVLVLVALLAALVSLVLIANTPTLAIPWADKDDALFVRLAMSIRETGWLGAFDELTLAKGMAYPILLAVADALSVPAKIAEHLVYLAGAGAMGWVVARLSRRSALGVVLLVALALDPVWYMDALMRIRRETMYAGTELMLMAGIAWLFLVRLQDARVWRMRDYLGSVVVGLAAGVYWLVREEGIWLVPTVGLIAAVGLVRAVASADPGSRARSLARSGSGALALAVGFVIVVGGVTALNGVRYGVAVTNDFRDGAFPRAVGAFIRIEEDPPERYVAVSAAGLRAAYAASPAAAELESYLEEAMPRTARNNCHFAQTSRFLKVRNDAINCEDMAFGWFPWELRHAIAAAGHWDDGPESQEFMNRLADEIDAACTDGLIACGPPVVSTSPPLTSERVREAIELFPTAFAVLSESLGPTGKAVSRGEPQDLLEWARFIHGPIAPPESDPLDGATGILVTGFVASPVGTPDIHVEREESTDFTVKVTTRSDPEVLTVLDPEDAQLPSVLTETGGLRFRIETDCLADDCILVVDHGDGTETAIPMWALDQGWTYPADGTVIRVAEASEVSPEVALLPTVGTPHDDTVLAVQRWLDGLYRAILPVLSLLAVAGCVMALLVPVVRRRSFLLGTLTVAAGVAVLVRFGLIGLLEVSAWPGALAIAKLSPASPFLITFAVLGTYLLVQSIVSVARGLRQRRAPLS